MKRIFLSFVLCVISTFVATEYLQWPVLELVMNRSMSTIDSDYDEYLYGGVFNLLEKELLSQPEESRVQYIREKIQPDFSYPVALVAINKLPENLRHDGDLLYQGHIVKDGSPDSRFVSLFMLLKGSDQVIRLGPVQSWLGSIPPATYAVIYVLVFLVAMLPVMYWATGFYLRLRHIQQTADRFGDGDFNARAKVNRFTAMAPLAATINSMTARIADLIQSHRQLTRAVSHELRTPLARIRFALEAAENSQDEAAREEALAEVRQDIGELDSLVSDLLMYSRFERGAPELPKQRVQLLKWFQGQQHDSGRGFAPVPVHWQVAESVENLPLQMVPRYVSLALSNLITNAGKYARSEVKVTLEQQEGQCVIHVDDDGPGIQEADRVRIFEPFTRLDSSRGRETGGTGLGLAIVRQIALWHGGSVAALESPMGGARFSLTLAMAGSAAEPG